MHHPISVLPRHAGPVDRDGAVALLREVVRGGRTEVALDDGELGRRLLADLRRLGPVVDRRGDGHPTVSAEVEVILDAVASGATVAQAASAAHVSLRTAHRRLRLAADRFGVGSVQAALIARHRQLSATGRRASRSVGRDAEVAAGVAALRAGGIHLLDGPAGSGVTHVLERVAVEVGADLVPTLDLGRTDQLDLVLLGRARPDAPLVIDDGQWLSGDGWELVRGWGAGVLVGGHELADIEGATTTVLAGIDDDDLLALHAGLTGTAFGGRNRRDLLRVAAGRPGRVVQLTDPEAAPGLIARLLAKEPQLVLAPDVAPPGGWLRSLLRQILDGDQLRDLHRSIAAACTDPVVRAAHLARAGDDQAALAVLEAAPEDLVAVARGAARAADLEETALRNEVMATLTDGADATAHADRAAAAYLHLGWMGDARRVALRTYQRLHELGGQARQLGALAGIVGETGNVVEAVAMVDEVLARTDVSAADRTYLRMIRAGLAVVSGDATAIDVPVELHAISADAEAESLDDEVIARILPGMAQAMLGDPAGLDVIVPVFEELLPTIGVLPGAGLKAAHLAELVGTLQARAGLPFDGLALMDRTLDHLARRGEAPVGAALALTRELLALGLTGPITDSLARVRAAMARNGDHRPSGAAGALLALQLADAGDVAGAEAALAYARTVTGDPLGPEVIRWVEAEVAYRAGRPEQALELALEALRRSGGVISAAPAISALAQLIRLELRADVDVPAATSSQPTDRWSVAIAAAVDALLADDPQTALEALEPAAIAPLIDARTPVLVGLVRARAHLAVGDAEAADRELADVEAGALARAEHGLVAQVRQLRRVGGTRATVAGGPRTRPTGALTDREIEVLGLVGEGLTSRQIGERLRVSASTVDSTVRRAMVKLGAPTRRAAAAEAAGLPGGSS